MTYSDCPWNWRPPRRGWFRRLCESSRQWTPAVELRKGHRGIVDCLVEAAEREAAWLYHPCLNALTLPGDANRLARDFQCAVWIAAHGELPSFEITVPTPMWLWSPRGRSEVAPGVYNLHSLGRSVAQGSWPWVLALDIWCDSVGFLAGNTWAACGRLSDEMIAKLREGVARFIRCVAVASQHLPECVQWLTVVSKVAIPLRAPSGYFRSVSFPMVPGAAYLTLGDEVQILESLVHEAAHQYFFLLEASGALVDPSHQKLYPSPLRPEPRPLRAILAAYHAVAYMAAYYSDALRARLVPFARGESQQVILREKLRSTKRILEANQEYLTETGRESLRRMTEVAAYRD